MKGPCLAVTVSNASFHLISILKNVSELNKFCSLLIQSFLTLRFLFIDFQWYSYWHPFRKHYAGCITAELKKEMAAEEEPGCKSMYMFNRTGHETLQ